MAYYNNTLFVTSLVGPSISALEIKGNEIIELGPVFSSIDGRIRDISVGLDGAFYVLTDGGNAELIKITHEH